MCVAFPFPFPFPLRVGVSSSRAGHVPPPLQLRCESLGTSTFPSTKRFSKIVSLVASATFWLVHVVKNVPRSKSPFLSGSRVNQIYLHIILTACKSSAAPAELAQTFEGAAVPIDHAVNHALELKACIPKGAPMGVVLPAGPAQQIRCVFWVPRCAGVRHQDPGSLRGRPDCDLLQSHRGPLQVRDLHPRAVHPSRCHPADV